MNNFALVTIEELDDAGKAFRSCASHMPRANVAGSLAAIQKGYDMAHTRIKVDGTTVLEPTRRRS